ncbi:MAG: hypothetical protein IH918_02385 [Acidobacteria bacterium]|nr:hypothetical protein [Acidobacteriota bacterium]
MKTETSKQGRFEWMADHPLIIIGIAVEGNRPVVESAHERIRALVVHVYAACVGPRENPLFGKSGKIL